MTAEATAGGPSIVQMQVVCSSTTPIRRTKARKYLDRIDVRRPPRYRSRARRAMQDIKQKVALIVDRRIGRADARQGRGRLRHRLARDPVGGRAFAARSRRDGDDLFRGARLRQAGRRGASLRPRQGRERHRARRDRAAVPALRRRDLGGAAAPARRPRPCGRGDALGVRRDRRLDRGRFLSRPRCSTASPPRPRARRWKPMRCISAPTCGRRSRC